MFRESWAVLKSICFTFVIPVNYSIMQNLTEKIEITELANKLFMYTDDKAWQKLKDEVFTPEVLFDMSSVGAGPATTKTADEICSMWNEGFAGIDHVHHQAGHYLVEFVSGEVDIFGYAVAYHYKKDAVEGNTRIFVGSYELHAIATPQGWRLNRFKYNLKFIGGNAELK